jgi:DNA-binding LacI/PurR family transcriptional regulator
VANATPGGARSSRTSRTNATVDDVARHAGVSRATVSRVVNDSPNVLPETRRVVERAVAELGYVPNRAARSLMTRRSELVGVVILEPADRLFGDPYFGQLLLGISEGLAARDFQLVLLMAPGAREEQRVATYLAAGHVDGAIFVGPHGDDPLPGRLAAAGLPVVLSGRPSQGAGISFVDADNRAGARLAVEHLLAAGRRRIATIHGTLDLGSGRDRLDGYHDALLAGGVPRDPRLEVAGNYSATTAGAAMERLIAQAPDLDAVFAASDSMAGAAVRVLQASGRRIPDDVAVVGFDDTPVARAVEPPLTTVRQPIPAMGREMARLLLQQLDEPGLVPSQVIFPTELVVRASSISTGRT